MWNSLEGKMWSNIIQTVCVLTQAGVAELRRAVGVEEGEQLVGKVYPLLPLDKSLLHIYRRTTQVTQRLYIRVLK